MTKLMPSRDTIQVNVEVGEAAMPAETLPTQSLEPPPAQQAGLWQRLCNNSSDTDIPPYEGQLDGQAAKFSFRRLLLFCGVSWPPISY